jgi:cysteine desulfurase/selenocysteine lyase
VFDSLRSKRSDFPILNRVTYLNSAFTSLTPRPVANKIAEYYLNHRASSVGPFEYLLDEIDTAYIRIATLIGSRGSGGSINSDNILITSSCSQAIETLAHALEYSDLSPGDNVVLSQLEYCSNATPWIRLGNKHGVEIRLAKFDPDTQNVPTRNFELAIDQRTRLVALAHVSNLTGGELHISEVSRIAHERGSLVLVDGAQSYSTLSVDVEKLGCDFYAFSGHKAMGPTGTGVLWSSEEAVCVLESLVPKPNYTDDGLPPYSRFWGNSASNYEGILGLGWVADYIRQIGIENIERYIAHLTAYLHDGLDHIKFIKKISPAQSRNLVSFLLPERWNVNDVADALYRNNVVGLVLGGNSFPFLPKSLLGNGAIRLSLHFYNNEEDIQRAMHILGEIAAGNY